MCRDLLYQEFDFLTNRWSEKACANLAINLKEGTGVRPYQMRAAFSLFWDNKVRMTNGRSLALEQSADAQACGG
jgi:hypothetical protein